MRIVYYVNNIVIWRCHKAREYNTLSYMYVYTAAEYSMNEEEMAAHFLYSYTHRV